MLNFVLSLFLSMLLFVALSRASKLILRGVNAFFDAVEDKLRKKE